MLRTSIFSHISGSRRFAPTLVARLPRKKRLVRVERDPTQVYKSKTGPRQKWRGEIMAENIVALDGACLLEPADVARKLARYPLGVS